MERKTIPRPLFCLNSILHSWATVTPCRAARCPRQRGNRYVYEPRGAGLLEKKRVGFSRNPALLKGFQTKAFVINRGNGSASETDQ